ncbi:RluA family pseudouridine synthase [Massilia sp. P8910]|uniref:RluA family pseudouridine synthase n=1 Tax=Massilia antarctica TaxID=2765360 RepID=UPI0006BB8999|nr:RluA family pseudouridine synthase [Massilia antarctica]MCY0910402.1 RluA family pseudouridine synthase [Massilia sp. H27-R4]CUI09250.1 Ribosomal large subunit pseudouridine synthase D [Janthinobacterium sp. CG23_2]CUU33036.1 Ribosomal large subunit pseudouridine synthase D [Janthinobacterium sp. CG23_2]
MILTPTPNSADLPLDPDLEIDLDDEAGDEYAPAAPGIDLSPIHLELTPDACGHRLDKVIAGLVPQFSRSRLQLWFEAGHVLVDGKPARGKDTAYGDEAVVILPQSAPEDEAYTPEAMELNIVFEDEHIIVINKPAGLVVHPGAGNWSGTLLNGLLHHCPQLAGVPRAGIVHRLDKDTSGLMVIGKTLAAQTDLVRQLQARSVKREYFALVWGTPQLSSTIDASMGRHPKDRVKMAVSTNFSAKPAITHYQRIATGMLDRRPVSLVQCQLETGRTHQIRVHMLSIGFALVGDAVYGKQHLTPVFPRQALQARRLGLVHPATGEDMEWIVPLADDFAELIGRAGIPEPEQV